DAAAASMSPPTSPIPTPPPPGLIMSPPTMTMQPPRARAKPIQNTDFGRSRKRIHVPRPTSIGELLVSTIAVVADALSTAVLKSARSIAKNAPPSRAMIVALADGNSPRRDSNQYGTSTTAATSARYNAEVTPGTSAHRTSGADHAIQKTLSASAPKARKRSFRCVTADSARDEVLVRSTPECYHQYVLDGNATFDQSQSVISRRP